MRAVCGRYNDYSKRGYDVRLQTFQPCIKVILKHVNRIITCQFQPVAAQQVF